jgi:haloalkane dehalogenase
VTAPAMNIFRTPDERFDPLDDYGFDPHYLSWNGLRLHHLDEPPTTGDAAPPVALLLHGEPTWSYLYRHWIGPLTSSGFRCVAPDHPGFGRSDKPTDDGWYVIDRHVEALIARIEALDLHRIHLVVQDWGGPIGLMALCEMPQRFERAFILNTWLHHDAFEYSDGIRWWRQAALDPTQLGGDMPTGRIVAGTMRRPGHDIDALVAAYDAPFPNEESKAGPRRFPYCIPFGDPVAGSAARQAAAFEQLGSLGLPIHFAFGDADPIFTFEWAERWHSLVAGSTLDRIENAGHFVQEDAPSDCLDVVLRHSARS